MKGWAFGLAVSMASVAQAEDVELAHQGRLLGADGTPISGDRTLVVSLWDHPDSPSTSDRVFVQTFSDIPVDAGFFSVVLGSGGTPLPSSVFDVSPLYVQHEVAGHGVIGPRTVLFRAPQAEVAWRVRSVPTPSGGCSQEGAIVFDRDADVLLVCDGAAWIAAGAPAEPPRTLVANGSGVKQWSDGSTSPTCLGYLSDPDYTTGAGGDGMYTIDADGSGGAAAPVQAWCDMTTSPGGWTLVYHAYYGDTTTETNLFTTLAANAITGPHAKGAHISLMPHANYALPKNAAQLRFVYHDLSGNLAANGKVAHQEVLAEGSFAGLFNAPGPFNYVSVTARETTGPMRVINTTPRVYWGTCATYLTSLRFDTYRDGSYYPDSSYYCHGNTYGNSGQDPNIMDFTTFPLSATHGGMGHVGDGGWGLNAKDHVYNIFAR
jgi:hypothetical protein